MSPWLGLWGRGRTAGRPRPAARPAAEPAAAPEAPAPAPAPLGARVRFTVDTVRSLKEAPKSPEEIEAGTAALRPQGCVGADLLHDVLAGDDGAAKDLTAVQLETLAEFYGLSPLYFLGTNAEIESIDAGLEYLRLVRDPATVGVPYLCTRGGPVDAALLRAHSHLMRELAAILADPEAHGAIAFHPSPSPSGRPVGQPVRPATNAQD